MDTFETRIKKMFTRFILLLALFSLPSISANTDCGGMPFSCVNSTFFKICVDFGNGISSTVDDFVIPCPPGTECRVTNHFECEAAAVPPKANAPTEKVTTISDAANHTKYKDERSVVTPMWEELPSVNPHEVEFSEKYLDTENNVTLADDTLSTTNVVVDVITEVTTKSMFLSNPDIAPFDTTTMKMVGATERNLKGSADYVDLLKATQTTTFYPGDITGHPTGISVIIPTSEVISTTFSENSDVIFTTERYADEDFLQADNPEIIIDSVNLKVSNINNNFVEITTLLNLEKSGLDNLTPTPWAEVHSTSSGTPTTDEIGGLNNPVSPSNVFDTTVQNQSIDLVFTTEANDVHSITLSLTPTDTTKDDVKNVNTGFPNVWNADLAPIEGNIVESYTASTESSADITFDTISTIPVEFTTDYISGITPNKKEFSVKNITQETANTNEIKNDVTPSIIVSDNLPTSTESITQAKEVTMHDKFNLENNFKQAEGNSGLEASQTYAVNQEQQSVGYAKNTPHELVSKKSTENDKMQPTAVVNSDNEPTESNLYPWNEQQHQITTMNIEQVTMQAESITKDHTSFLPKLYGENNYTGVDSSRASIDPSVAAEINKREQQGSKLNITDVAPSSVNNAQTPNLQKNAINIGETEAQQVRSDSGILAHVGDASEVVLSAVKNSESSISSQLDHITNKSDGPQIEQTRLVGIDKEAPHTVIETAETETQQIVRNTDETTTAPPLIKDTATFIASTLATMSQVPSPISEKDVNVNKPTASDVHGMITESLSQTKSDAIESTSQQTHVNGESLDQTIYLPGQDNIVKNRYGNIQADETVNVGSNSFSQTAPSSKTTSPLTETSIGFDESTLSEVNNAYHPEEAHHTVSISDFTADKRTSQLASIITEHTDFTAPATVIIGNVYTKMDSSTPGMVIENASGATSGVPSATGSSENTSNSPTKSASLQNTLVEAKSETASVQARNVPVEEPKHTVNANVADDILTVHSISKTTSPSQSKLLSVAQPPSIRKDETTAETGKEYTNINQQILQVNNGAPHPISEVAGADLTHSPNVADVDDISKKPTNVQPRPDSSIVYQASPPSVVWDADEPTGKISVNEIGDTVADINDISTTPTNVQPRPDISILNQESLSSVLRDADKPTGEIPENEKDVTAAGVKDTSKKPTNVQPRLDTSIVYQTKQSSVVRDSNKPTAKIPVNKKDVTVADVNDISTKPTNVPPRLDTSIEHQASQSSVVWEADKPTAKIPVNERVDTVADANDISTKPNDVQPRPDIAILHQASQSSVVRDADKPTGNIPVNEKDVTAAGVNDTSTKPTNVQPRLDISIVYQTSQSSVVRDSDQPTGKIPVNEKEVTVADVNDISTKPTNVQPRLDSSIVHQASQSSVVWDADKPTGKIPVNERVDTVADVNDISKKPTNVQPRPEISILNKESQSSVVRDADKPSYEIPVNESDVTAAGVNDTSTKPTNVQPRLDISIVYQTSQSSVVRDSDQPTGKIPVNEKEVTVADVNDISTKPTNVQPRLDSSIVHQASQSSVVWDADKPTGKIPVNERVDTVADVNDISKKPTNVQPRPEISILNKESQSSVVRDADKPSYEIPVNESDVTAAGVNDTSTKPTNVQPRLDISIVYQTSQSSVVRDSDQPTGKIPVNEKEVTVADVNDISTKPTNVQPRLDSSIVHQASQSSVVWDADKPTGKIPVNERVDTVADVNDISKKPTNVQPRPEISILNKESQSSVVRDADKPSYEIPVNESDVTAAGVNDTSTKPTNVQPRLDISIVYQTGQSSVVRDSDQPTGKIPVNEKEVTVADVNDISTKPTNVQPRLDSSIVHQASQSSVVWDADKPTGKIPVNERVDTVADVNDISKKPTNVQPRPEISILNKESQSSVVRDADKPSYEIPVNESDVKDISTKPTNFQLRPDMSIPHQESQSSEKPGTELLQSAAEPSKDVSQNPNDKIITNQRKVNELQIPKITSSVSYGQTSANTKGADPTIFSMNNSQVSNTHSTGFTSESPIPQSNFDKSIITTSTTVDNLKTENTGGQIKTDSLWHSTEATVVYPISSILSPLTTTEKVKLVAPTTTLQDVIVHLDKLVTKESEYRGNANQEVVKNPVTIAPTSNSKKTSATPSASIGFSCSNLTRGRYSDKDDCRKFHICIDQQGPIVGYCPDNTVFSEIKKQCTKNLSHCVRGNEFQCVSPGRYSDYLLKNVYYICVKNHNSYYRFKFQCQTGFYLNKTLVRCMPNIEGSVESVSSDDVLEKDSDQRDKRSTATSTATSTSTSTERIVRRTKKPKENKSSAAPERNQRRNRNECEEVGKFAHPEDCRKYYVCYNTSRSQLRRRRKKCDSDEVFHKDKRKCVDAESYECDL